MYSLLRADEAELQMRGNMVSKRDNTASKRDDMVTKRENTMGLSGGPW